MADIGERENLRHFSPVQFEQFWTTPALPRPVSALHANCAGDLAHIVFELVQLYLFD